MYPGNFILRYPIVRKLNKFKLRFWTEIHEIFKFYLSRSVPVTILERFYMNERYESITGILKSIINGGADF